MSVFFLVLTFLKTNLLKSSHKKRVSPIVHLGFSKKSLQKINVRFFYSAYKNDRKKPDIYFLQRGIFLMSIKIYIEKIDDFL